MLVVGLLFYVYALPAQGLVARQNNNALPHLRHHVSVTSSSPSSTALGALTERQMQFWEDVDAGLDDIENFYVKKGQDIDRIRIFAKT